MKIARLAFTSFLFLLSLPFLAVGLLTLSLYFYQVFHWSKMKNLVLVPATIHSAELVTSSDSESTTYKSIARYSYKFNEQSYESDQVSLSIGFDNFGEFHKELVDSLQYHRDSMLPFTCYVDPNRPEKSVLYRRARVGIMAFLSIFGLTFTPIGLGLGYAVLFGSKIEKNENLRRLEHPDRPWLWKKDWESKTIKNELDKQFIALRSFAIFLLLICLPLFFIVIEEITFGNLLALYALIIPAFGFVIAYIFLLKFVARQRFGILTLNLQTNPIRKSEKLNCRVIVPGSGASLLKEVPLKLYCKETFVSGSGDDRQVKVNILTEKKSTGQIIYDGPRGYYIPIEFDVPDDAESTCLNDPRKISWILEVGEKGLNSGIRGEFELPVF